MENIKDVFNGKLKIVEDFNVKIRFQLYKSKDEKMVRILEIKNVLPLEKLPKEYLESCPKYYKKDNKMYVCDKKNVKVYQLYEGCTFSLNRFQRILTVMEEAGQRLKQIKKDNNDTYSLCNMEIKL